MRLGCSARAASGRPPRRSRVRTVWPADCSRRSPTSCWRGCPRRSGRWPCQATTGRPDMARGLRRKRSGRSRLGQIAGHRAAAASRGLRGDCLAVTTRIGMRRRAVLLRGGRDDVEAVDVGHQEVEHDDVGPRRAARSRSPRGRRTRAGRCGEAADADGDQFHRSGSSSTTRTVSVRPRDGNRPRSTSELVQLLPGDGLLHDRGRARGRSPLCGSATIEMITTGMRGGRDLLDAAAGIPSRPCGAA